jgi:hypothetical protein
MHHMSVGVKWRISAPPGFVEEVFAEASPFITEPFNLAESDWSTSTAHAFLAI